MSCFSVGFSPCLFSWTDFPLFVVELTKPIFNRAACVSGLDFELVFFCGELGDNSVSSFSWLWPLLGDGLLEGCIELTYLSCYSLPRYHETFFLILCHCNPPLCFVYSDRLTNRTCILSVKPLILFKKSIFNEYH